MSSKRLPLKMLEFGSSFAVKIPSGVSKTGPGVFWSPRLKAQRLAVLYGIKDCTGQVLLVKKSSGLLCV